MKSTILTFALFTASILSFGQIKTGHQTVRPKVVELKVRPYHKVSTDVVHVRKLTFIGNFVVTGYHILSTDIPRKFELERIVGSNIKVDAHSITGTQIDPRSFNLTQSKMLSRSAYIAETFGRQVKVKEPDLPDNVLVHHTDHENCKGFVEIDRDHLAVPYKGVLLFLKRQ